MQPCAVDLAQATRAAHDRLVEDEMRLEAGGMQGVDAQDVIYATILAILFICFWYI